MNKLAKLIEQGEYYFGTGTTNTEGFNKLFESFKRSFKKELKQIDAKDIVFSKGHFYISGFFTVQDQPIYFSVSDVRSYMPTDWKGTPQMLVRTAKDYKDFTGGANRYVSIESGMSREILRNCNLDTSGFKKHGSKKVNYIAKVKKIVDDLKENGIFEGSIPSSNKADSIAWRVGEALGHTSFSITTYKLGRYKIKSQVSLEGFEYYYDAQSKRIRFSIEMTDEQLLESLSLRDESEVISNMFTGDKVELEPLGVALHDFIKGCEVTKQYTLMQQALGIFRKKYPSEYMVLLD